MLAATFFATRNARDQVAEEPTPQPVQQAEAVKAQPEQAEKSKPRADKSRETAARKTGDKQRADKQRAGKERGAARRSAAKPSPAGAVKRAVKGDRLVVLFFYARGSDDRRVANSVASLRGRTKAAVFSDRIGNLGKYGQIATSVGVTRSPSIVIIGKGNRGRLIEGYIDPDTLAQRVADAR